ncbi:hypothetical protein BRE01_44500 [Brevibacillus reuszeri]|uniref:Flagellin Flp1-like domain-containing protein n=1 Tax=Brevibacillus reuszeri TaxID=54915 RepID=A0ABQ0TS44_9BACL|nr:hypothetical protein BRE01_44500 [Brevibacillus reuszeri]
MMSILRNEKGEFVMINFDGEAFSEIILIIILVALLLFGSTDIMGLSAQPTKA